MNETKEKIQAMIEEQTAENRRQDFDERRSKKSKNKVKKERTPLGDEKKNLVKSLSIVAVLFFSSMLLFYGASIAKHSAEKKYQQTLETKAKQYLDTVIKETNQILGQKISKFDYIFKDPEYIKNFTDQSWQEVIKTDLAARFGEGAIVEIIPENFSNDEIIDNPEMGYGILSLLNELKETIKIRSGHAVKIEVHRTKNDAIQLLFISTVIYTDDALKEDVALGYILVRLAKHAINELVKEIDIKNDYIEIVQPFSGKASVLASKGNQQLKNMPLFVSKKIKNTQWRIKYWPESQKNEPPVSFIWQAIAYLALGSLALVFSLVLLVSSIKNFRTKQKLTLPERKKRSNKPLTATHNSPDIMRSKEATGVIYAKDSGITVEDDYLTHITENIFRAYDIRGVVGEFINAEVFREIAYSIAAEMAEQQQTQISIGFDGRNSSPELVKAVIDALLESGINVLDIGMVTSPILYFSAITKTDGNGIIVTASHNPANYNGMKIMLSGHSYSDVRLQSLKKRVLNGERVSGNGNLTEQNVFEDYMTKITGNVILARPMSIVIDSGNGVTGKFATTFFEQLGCRVTALNSEVDGNFPAHDPDPSRPENMSELIQKVTETKADLGIAFDGDGDRIGLIASGGEIIWPDRILMLLAKDILSRNKDVTILYDVKSSWKLEHFINELGGTALMCKSGHSFMKSKLLETKALLAGEMSGHIFIKERWFGFDDALFVAARVLEILSIDLRKSRQIFAELPDSLNTPEILVATDNSKGIMEKMLADTSCFDDARIITIDGIRAEYKDGWGLVRASNTTDNLTMRFEADNEEALQRIAITFKNAVLASEPKLEFPF